MKKQAGLILLYTFICKIIMSQLHIPTRSVWGNKTATNLLINFDAHRSHHRMFDKQPALEDTRRNLWVQVHVPVRSRVRASTFWDGGQNFLFNFFCFTELAANSTFQRVLYGEQRNEKTSRSHTVIYFYMQNHHEPTLCSNAFCMGNKQDDRKQVHVLASSLSGLKAEKYRK